MCIRDRTEIERRQQAIEELNMNYISREEIREYLNSVYDLERLMGRISYKTANPRDLLSFKNSLEKMCIRDSRKQYVADIKASLRGHLNNISIVEKDGSVTDLGKKYGNVGNTES